MTDEQPDHDDRLLRGLVRGRVWVTYSRIVIGRADTADVMSGDGISQSDVVAEGAVWPGGGSVVVWRDGHAHIRLYEHVDHIIPPERRADLVVHWIDTEPPDDLNPWRDPP